LETQVLINGGWHTLNSVWVLKSQLPLGAAPPPTSSHYSVIYRSGIMRQFKVSEE